GQMLDGLCALAGWSRRQAIRGLHDALHPPERGPRPPRARTYGPEVLGPCDGSGPPWTGPTGKRLAPFMAEAVAAMERHEELEVTPQVRVMLLAVSAATIDRML